MAVLPTTARSPGARPTLRQWVRDHDESWLFVLIYLGLAVGLSVFVSLFWLVVVAGLHLLLELLRQSFYRDAARDVTLHALWEVKLDVGLILLALALVLYIDVVLGILGLQSATRAAAVTRAGSRIGVRAAAWERNLRTFLVTVDEMARLGHAAVMFGRKRKTSVSGEAEADQCDGTDEVEGDGLAARRPSPPDEPWHGRWGMGDRFGVGILVAGAVFILGAPLLTGHDVGSAGAALLAELRPFPK